MEYEEFLGLLAKTFKAEIIEKSAEQIAVLPSDNPLLAEVDSIKQSLQLLQKCYESFLSNEEYCMNIYPEYCQNVLKEFLSAKESRQYQVDDMLATVNNLQNPTTQEIEMYRKKSNALFDAYQKLMMNALKNDFLACCKLGHKTKASLGLIEHKGPYD